SPHPKQHPSETHSDPRDFLTEFFLRIELASRFVGVNTTLPQMIALPRTRRRGVNVQRARAAQPVLLRGFAGHSWFSATSNVRPRATRQRGPESIRGFTLIELVIVIGIIGLLLVLIAPAFTTIKGGTDVTSAAYTIKGALETARTYGKANNTYTWVGFFEEDASQSS